MEPPVRPAPRFLPRRPRASPCYGPSWPIPRALCSWYTRGAPRYGGWSQPRRSHASQGISYVAGPVWGWTLALGVFFLFGALDIQTRGAATRLDTSIQPYADGQELQVAALVIYYRCLQPGGFGEIRQTLDVEAEQTTTATGQTVPVHSGVRLSIYSPHPDHAQENSAAADASGIAHTFHCDERVRFLARLKLPRNFRKPSAFDYQGYLADVRACSRWGTTAARMQLHRN